MLSAMPGVRELGLCRLTNGSLLGQAHSAIFLYRPFSDGSDSSVPSMQGLIPGSGRSPGEGNGSPLQ